jgi:hypothetical protein
MISCLSRILRGDDLGPPTYILTRRIFLGSLGAIYILAFASLGAQILGLAGQDGIEPVAALLAHLEPRPWPERLSTLPTVFWIAHGDPALRIVCWGGVISGALLLLDRITLPAALAAWILYLSLQTTCGIFLQYQWDILLLETGFLAIFLAPFHLWGRSSPERPPPLLIIWLLRWLLFRLMLLSGLVKWLSGDGAWRQFTALEFHYETQPLPTWLGWYAHQLPVSVHQACVVAMFVIEVAFPFLIFAPRRPRALACAAFVLLQVGIMATGNYGYFNLLTIALSLVLLDDAAWPRRWSARVTRHAPPPPAVTPRRWPAWIIVPLSVLILVLSCVPTLQRVGVDVWWPPWIQKTVAAVRPFRLVNSYGLFTVMTRRRSEITIEGSHDGREWHGYGFRWKPGDPAARPRFVQPHQPRLDWQMWFAALGPYQRQYWLHSLMRRLLDGSPDVVGLFGRTPFPDDPPRYIRATIADYRFTDPVSAGATGHWWTLGPGRPYSPVLQRRID